MDPVRPTPPSRGRVVSVFTESYTESGVDGESGPVFEERDDRTIPTRGWMVFLFVRRISFRCDGGNYLIGSVSRCRPGSTLERPDRSCDLPVPVDPPVGVTTVTPFHPPRVESLVCPVSYTVT